MNGVAAKIAIKGAARREARAVLELVLLNSPEAVDAFIDEITLRLKPKTDEKKKTEAKTLRELSEYVLDFGVYRGWSLVNVIENDPRGREYLHWLVEKSEESLKTIAAFLEATKKPGEV